MNKVQRENLGKFFIDIAKILVAVYVFTSLPESPGRFAIGIIITVFLLTITIGLGILGGVTDARGNN
ncbi:MAG TPA: hypothetical protein ACFYD3_11370 [Candidatus Hypogeohydataceae bacterium YC41]